MVTFGLNLVKPIKKNRRDLLSHKVDQHNL